MTGIIRLLINLTMPSQRLRHKGQLVQPDNIFEFSAAYFAEKRRERDDDGPTAAEKDAQKAAVSNALGDATAASDFRTMSEALHGACSLSVFNHSAAKAHHLNTRQAGKSSRAAFVTLSIGGRHSPQCALAAIGEKIAPKLSCPAVQDATRCMCRAVPCRRHKEHRRSGSE